MKIQKIKHLNEIHYYEPNNAVDISSHRLLIPKGQILFFSFFLCIFSFLFLMTMLALYKFPLTDIHVTELF